MLDIWQICRGKGEYEDGLQRGRGPLNEMKHYWELDSQRTVVLNSIVFANALMYEDNGIKYREYRALFYEGH
jgi:hypothetical protein